VGLLHTGNALSVHGAMRVIAEFVKNDLSEDQLLPVVRDLLPALLQVLGDSQVSFTHPACTDEADVQTHSYTTRSECVATFRQVLRMLETVREEHPAAVKQALEDVGGVWLGAFRQLLAADAKAEVEANWESLGLRIEIFRVSSSCPLRGNTRTDFARRLPLFNRPSLDFSHPILPTTCPQPS
jgi:hypothetical protein